jgi:tRNA nucleotidyltransferase (CCA-adding enzyme)
VTGASRLELPADVLAIPRTLEDAGFETWCVGGAVRDWLLGHPGGDVDFATSATPEAVQRLFKQTRTITIPVGIKFGTVGVLDRRRQLHEVTTFRRDVTTDGRHAVVEYGVSLEEDLARRDFTINAIAYHPIRHELRDPFAGKADLDARMIRAVGRPADRFREDYLRILRAIRFATRFEFAIEPATWAEAKAAAGGLARLSAERVRDEWFRSLETARSVRRLLELWREVGAAQEWLPELRTDYPLAVDAPESRDPVLLTALLSSDPVVSLTRLKASTQEIDRSRRIARGPSEPSSAGPVEVRRWLSVVGAGAEDLRTAASLRAGGPPAWAPVMAGILERGEAVTRGQLAVTGDDLKALGIAPGPGLGDLLERLLARVVEDPSLNRREALLELARAIE